MSGAFTIPTIFTAINKFSAPVANMARSVTMFASKSSTALGRVEKAFSGLISPITAFNRMLAGAGLYIGLFTLVALLRSAVGVVADFEEAQINISSVTGRSIQQNKALAMQARQMAVDYGLAAVEVSKLQYELIKMGFAERKGGIQNVLDATPAITLGAKAMNAPVDELAKLIGSGMQLFNRPAQELVDIYSKGLDLSALDFESLSTMVRNSQSAWALAGKGPEELVATLAVLSNAFVHTASAGTGLKNLTIDNAVAAKEMNKQLMLIAQAKDPLVAAYKMYGRRTFQAALPLSKGLVDGDTAGLLKKLKSEANGYAKALADIRLQGINAKWTQAKSSWQELILSIDDGTGKLAQTARTAIDVFRAMNLITAGSEAATNALKGMNPATIATAQSFLFWTKWIFRATVLLLVIKAALLAWSAIVWVANAALVAYNVVLGISAGLTGVYSLAVGQSAVAIGAAKVAVWLMTAAQWAWNAAMAANPIGLIIIAIAALIALVVVIIAKWNEWGAALSLFIGPLGWVVSLIQSFRRNWDMIKEAFSSGGIIAGIKAIGKVIFDALLMPLQQLFLLMSNLPGAMGESSKKMYDLLAAYRSGLGVNVSTNESGEPIAEKVNPRVVNTDNKNVKVDFANMPSGAKVSGDMEVVGDISPAMGSTFGAFGPGSLFGDWK